VLLAALVLAWSGPGASHLGAPSPDGRFLSGIHPESGELLIRDLTSGIQRRLGHKAAMQEHASLSVFSPDSKFIAYGWLNADRRYELRIADVDSLTEQTVFRINGDGMVRPSAFTPDSKQILTLLVRGPRVSEIALISIETGAARIVKRLYGDPPRRIDLSPDGRWIVYRNSQLAVDGSSEQRLVIGLDGDLSPMFSRDSRALFLIARDAALWRAGLDDHKPIQIHAGIGPAYLQGTTQDGRVYFGLRVGAGNVYRAKFDAAAGKLGSEPEAIGESEPESSLAPVAGTYRARLNDLWREGAATPVATFPRAITALAVAPDGETVAVAQSTTLTVISPKGRVESRAASETISGLAWTRDGQHIITVQNDSLWWWSPNLESFRRIVKLSQGSIGSVTLSPDNTSIMFTAGRPRSEVWSIAVDAR
jgi:Tol biopolymer transport system component